MEKMTKPKVPVTEDDKQKSYYKYYLMDMASVAPEKMGKVFGGPMNLMKTLLFAQRNRLFDPGYFDEEIGYCVLPDGTGYVSDLNYMPGVTAEMIDWWFAWRGLDPLRYVISNPEDHIQAVTMQMDKVRDPKLNYSEKYWDTTQIVVKKSEIGPEAEFLNFKCPADLGFDMDKIGTEYCSTMVCARGYGKGNPPFAKPDYLVCHMVRDVEGGVEVRTRYWLGWTVRYGKDYKELPDGFRMPPMLPMGTLIQNMKEWTNLAAILPQLYVEEKENF
jgi:hypothetical protein